MEQSREKGIYRVTLWGSFGNLLLLAFKFVCGIVGHSQAMIADAVHSLSDFVTDIVVLVFVGISARPEDESHDYGHGKFETVASLFIGMALAAAAIGIVVSGSVKFAAWLGGEQLPAPGKLALVAALFSIVLKEVMYQYTAAKGRKLESSALKANAWHHRSDALSSVGAAVGIGGAILLGNRWTVLDPLASIVVGAMLVKVAWDLIWPGISELTEGSLPEETEKEIVEILLSDPALSEPHNLRTRRIGNRIAIEVHIRMDGGMPLEQAHLRATMAEERLRERFGKSTHIIIHMEPRRPVRNAGSAPR
jgi:cation diffusion facilitator family transporter